MAYTPVRTFVKTMASADSVAVFDTAEPWQQVYLQVPTMASNTAIDIYAGADSSNFYQVRQQVGNTTTVQAWSFVVAASAGANGAIVPIPGGFQFYKIKATDSAPTAATVFKLICSD